MKRIIVRYKGQARSGSQERGARPRCYDELHRTKPSGLRYATFRSDDGVSFIHLSVTETDDGTSPLSAVEAFKRFQENIAERARRARS